MLQLNENWDSYGRSREFQVDGIVVDEDASNSLLIFTIAQQLMIDTSEKIIEIKYNVNEHCPPMEIRNDMGVRVYMETKKENKNLGSYPLCIIVRDFNMELSITNENTVAVKLKKTADECFLYAFVAICTSISGWKYCRPVVVVDGTFLKSAYMGIMLTSSTMNAASTILPLAYAVVDSENDASWKWFFEQFKHAYGERPNMCVVSDRNESILKETSIVYPGMPHYSCMWHIWTNIRAKFKKGYLKLSELYFATARSYTLDEFNERMSKIEEIDPRVKVYLYDIDYHRWSRVHATVNRTWTMTSNIAESLNAVTKYARELPIVELLEYMRTLLERWTKEKLLKAKCTFTYLGFKFNKELDDNKTLSHKLRVRASTDYIHTVLDGVRRYIICLENKRCSCGQFQLDELPCPHALTALRHRDESFEQYCSPYYTRKNLLRTYEIPVNPMPDESK
uniref:Protein FAR1-RELATED SEQUENCE 5-like n=1 Tax=Nicotiana tabacum TaxID=4097 RepID=A0A1S3Z4J8_TOBAC|nr:PREDICTED: protein FAR1-RELATED SEQUENCE 5-like [Nicotiana tabacum]